MQPIPSLVANILVLSIAVLPGAAESTSVEPFCDWEATSKHITIRNGPLRRTDNADQEDENLSALSEDHTGPVKPDDGRVLHVDAYMHVVGRPKADDSSEFLVTVGDGKYLVCRKLHQTNHGITQCETLTKQVDVLNKSFTPANISFTTRHRLLAK